MELETYAKINTFLNIHQSYELRDIKKTSKKQLEVLIANNKELQKINAEAKLANATNKQILENQIKEIQVKEEQKYYKSLSFNMSETIECISKIKDNTLKYYFVLNNYERIKNTLLIAIDSLDEITDKQYNKNLIEKLNDIYENSEQYKLTYQSSLLISANQSIEELLLKEDEILNAKKPNYNIPIVVDKPKTSWIRLVGLILTGFIGIPLFLTLFIAPIKSVEEVIIPLVFFAPFVYLLFKEITWRKGYDNYLISQNEKRQNLKNQLVESENRFTEIISKKKDELKKLPCYDVVEKIHIQYPEFESTVNLLTDIDNQFKSKWNIASEKTSFTIILKDIGLQKLNVAKILKDIKKATLMDVLALKTPTVLFENISKSEAEKYKVILEKAGAIVEIQ